MHASWGPHLQPYKPHAQAAHSKALEASKANKMILPKQDRMFAAFNTAFDDVKVVIIGQDPYHHPGQANGYAFSVNKGVDVPPSLENIYKELMTDQGVRHPSHGDLDYWVRQGVLLLNTALTVEAYNPGSHKDFGWHEFTSGVIQVLSDKCKNLVFILWGAHAQKAGANIDTTKHLVIKSAHPSPLSAHRGFFGSKPFSQANNYLKEHGKSPIDWQVI